MASGELAAILDSARARGTRRIAITAYRGAVLLSDGNVVVERPDIAARRAAQVAELLQVAALTTGEYRVSAEDAPAAPDGADDAAQRRVTVDLSP